MINSQWRHVRQGMQLQIKGQTWEVEYADGTDVTLWCVLLGSRRSGNPKPGDHVVILHPGDTGYVVTPDEKAWLARLPADQWREAVRRAAEMLGGVESKEASDQP